MVHWPQKQNRCFENSTEIGIYKHFNNKRKMSMAFNELIFILIVGLIPLIAFIDILLHEFRGNNKLVWLLAVILVPVIGAIVYFIAGRKQQITS